MVLYFSTSCLSNKISLNNKLAIFNDLSIQNVELSYSDDPTLDFSAVLNKYDMNYIGHNYFPPPEEDFVINLASPSPENLSRSIEQIKRSISFCNDVNINFFSFHSGFRVDPDLQFCFSKKLVVEPYRIVFQRFLNSLREINEFAEKRNVKISIENNILAPYNLLNGENQLLLMCEEWEFSLLFKTLTSKNIGILLDLGHLKVTGNVLGFKPEDFIQTTIDRIYAIHISENDGTSDQDRVPESGDWVVQILEKYFADRNIYLILESKFQDIKELEDFVNNSELLNF